jgi:hypothetical protein
MGYFLVAILVAALYHFIYESILAPSWRLKLRFELFVLRDKVRALKVDHGVAFQDKHYHYLQDSINTLLSLLARFDLATLGRIEAEMKRNPELQQQSDERSQVLDDCDLEDAKLIRYASLRIAIAALAVNSGGWFIYVLPPLSLALGLKRYFSSFRQRIKAVVAIPQSEINKFAPASTDLSLGLAC